MCNNEMPYIYLKDYETGEINSSYTWFEMNELPNGWQDLFKQLCEEIREPLERAGLLNDFYFVQVKEKFNELRCYVHNSNDEVDKILDKYESIACKYCTCCGKPATKITTGYIASYCDDCVEKNNINEKYNIKNINEVYDIAE